jgi:hypothetical protein
MMAQFQLDLERYAGLQAAIEEAAKRFGFGIVRVDIIEHRDDYDVTVDIVLKQGDAPKGPAEWA